MYETHTYISVTSESRHLLAWKLPNQCLLGWWWLWYPGFLTAFFLFSSSSASSVHLSLCLPSNLPTHPCVLVSVCMPVSLHEPLLSWLSGARCLGGRTDHDGVCYSHINIRYCQSGHQWTTLACSGVQCFWWQIRWQITIFDTASKLHYGIYYTVRTTRQEQKLSSCLILK